MKVWEGKVPYIVLTPPGRDGNISLDAALNERRSVRKFKTDTLEDWQVSQLLWAACGTNAYGTRTIPSAGALYPIEVYAVMDSGVWEYRSFDHHLYWTRAEDYKPNDVRKQLAEACVKQTWIADAPLTIVITAVPERTTGKYGAKGHRYVCMEAGAISQNVSLQATALGLGSVIIGAFEDDKVHQILDLPPTIFPLLIMPVGKIKV